MILDCHADHARAMLYDVLDLDSGRWLTDEPITYVDDEAGVYIVLLRDAKGNYYLDPNNPDEVAREERRGRIKCCLKPEYESEEQGLAIHTAEQERARREVEEGRIAPGGFP
jgi:hypothetical protein